MSPPRVPSSAHGAKTGLSAVPRYSRSQRSHVVRGDLEYLGTEECPAFRPWATDGTRGGDILRGKAQYYRERGY